MDAILELYAEDNPSTFTFRRGGDEKPTVTLANWANRLTGAALNRFLGVRFNPKVAAMSAARLAKQVEARKAQAAQIGFRKGGKKVDLNG